MADEDYKDIAIAGVELAVTVGLIEASMGTNEDGWPEEVKENFQDKVTSTVEQLNGMVMEFLQFGAAYDDPREGD